MTDTSTGSANGAGPAQGTDGLELEERHSLRRIANLRTELEDISEVE